MFCNVCGHNLGNDVEGTCKNCGASKAMRQTQHNLDSNQGYFSPAPPVPPPPSYPPHNPYSSYCGYTPHPGKGKAIASLVLGICSIIFFYIPLAGLIIGIIGLALAAMSRREGFFGGLRSGGLVCSIIGTVFSSIFNFILLIGLLASM